MTESIIKFPVCYENGVGILEKITLSGNLELSEAVVNDKNNFAITSN